MCDCDSELSHREAIQSVAGLTIDRMSRDLDHIVALFAALNFEDTEDVDALNVLTDCGKQIHALMHRLDDGLLTWVQEKHTAAVLVDG